ncbi:hypothetical protein NMG60_11000424 [Bertholletia excelsa]
MPKFLLLLLLLCFIRKHKSFNANRRNEIAAFSALLLQMCSNIAMKLGVTSIWSPFSVNVRGDVWQR